MHAAPPQAFAFGPILYCGAITDTMAAPQTVTLESVLQNLDSVSEEYKKHVAVLCKAVEIAQLKGAYGLRDAKLVAQAFEAFVPENVSTITPPAGAPAEGT